MKPQELAKALRDFVEKHAKISPRYEDDPEYEDKYTGPDPYQLLGAAECIERGIRPDRVWSDWGSGCYRNWGDKALREEHDALVTAALRVRFDVEDEPSAPSVR
jgi:hypothetical protein